MKTIEITYRYGDPDAVPPRARPADAEAARRRMDEGSRAFAELFAHLDTDKGLARRVVTVDPRDLGLLGSTGAPTQRPYAAVLGCADARVPVELIFNEGPNDLFVVRVAGNTLGEDVRGSLKYALDHLGESLKLVVVLGHSGCGAVSAAVDVFLDPAGYLGLAAQHALRALVDRLQLVVQAAARRMAAVYGVDIARHPRYREALIEVAVATNAALAAHTVQREITTDAASAVRAAWGVYLLEERAIWAPRADSDATEGLASPPADAAGFFAFGEAVLASRRIAGMLASQR